MKLPAVLILCFLALCGARGADFFGTPAAPVAPGKPGTPEAIEFLNIPWNATPAEAKRVMALPPGAVVKEDTPDRIVLTGGAFETYEVDRWELEFVNGKFTKGVIQLVRHDVRNAKGWLNDQTFDATRDAFDKKYGKSVGRTGSNHTEQVWECKDSSGAMATIKLYAGWDRTKDPRFNITYSYDRSPPLATHASTEAAQSVAAASTPGDPASRDLVKTYRNSLVFVTGADGSGSGFVARLNEANFLFTNAHVAAGIKGAGFKSLDGTKVAGGAPAIAVGHDIFRMQLAAGGTPFEVMQGVDEKVTIDDEVVVLGNSEGAGVINTIKGKVVGVGPNLVEVDAPFQPGNSGSPIIHLKTGKVIGVATYLTIKKYDAATKEVLKAPVIRRFGYRLDSVKTWQPVAWPAFYAQAAEVQAIETLTGDLDNFLVDLSKNHGRVTTGAHANPAIKMRIDQWLAEKKKRMSPKDAAAADQNFISFLKVACRSDTTAAQPRLTYDYFQRQLGEQQQQRGEIADIFDKIIKDIQKDR